MTKLSLAILLFQSVILLSCGNQQTQSMQDKEDVTTSQSLPIDGVYKMSSDVERGLKNVFRVIAPDQKVKFEKGIAYYTSTSIWDKNLPDGKVFLKDIRKVSNLKYKAEFFPLSAIGVRDTTFTITILVEGNNLKAYTPPLGIVKVSQEITFELIQ